MRRRLVILALALDTLGALAAPAALPAVLGLLGDDVPRYERIAGTCVELDDEADAMLSGQPVADVWCAALGH